MSEEGRKITIRIPSIKIPKISPWMVSTAILAVLLVAFWVNGVQTTGMAVCSPSATEQGEVLTTTEAGNKVMEYINNNLVQSGKASVASVEDMGTVYKVMTSYQGQEIPVYITKDGSYLFLNGYDTSQQQPKEQTQEQPQTTDVPKTDRPEAHAFVMSYCPYGLQFMKAYVPVIELLGDKADLELNFVNYVMHGEKEMTENTRMYCIQKEQKDKFTAYLRCFVESDNVEKCIAEAGIDKTSLEACMQKTDDEFKITETFKGSQAQFPPYNVDAVLAQQYGVRGSPTFVVNGQTIQVTRSANGIKEAVCSAFNTPPAECNQELSTNAESPGIGPIGSGSGASSGSQCG